MGYEFRIYQMPDGGILYYPQYRRVFLGIPLGFWRYFEHRRDQPFWFSAYGPAERWLLGLSDEDVARFRRAYQ